MKLFKRNTLAFDCRLEYLEHRVKQLEQAACQHKWVFDPKPSAFGWIPSARWWYKECSLCGLHKTFCDRDEYDKDRLQSLEDECAALKARIKPEPEEE